jgi:hypothetical protein
MVKPERYKAEQECCAPRSSSRTAVPIGVIAVTQGSLETAVLRIPRA